MLICLARIFSLYIRFELPMPPALNNVHVEHLLHYESRFCPYDFAIGKNHKTVLVHVRIYY